MSRVFFFFEGLTVILLPILVVPGLILVITVFLSLGFHVISENLSDSSFTIKCLYPGIQDYSHASWNCWNDFHLLKLLGFKQPSLSLQSKSHKWVKQKPTLNLVKYYIALFPFYIEPSVLGHFTNNPNFHSWFIEKILILGSLGIKMYKILDHKITV